ncbi:ATP-binding cassette domain-containing protein [Lactobacillus sp. S2-2]|uniref:ABC transporter ATP-binding protein n=1 Tax=Lactobacillus sp. S2-2 TaxID=2692917 RepID=UPI001F1EAF4C|nr:ABC transporter ATP-binding protein [Lactobacillus sp. S2-2]MCF6515163.1 ATP-binding cassette domain-containing protein [Lactobacillus sp. S2-2]
MTLKVNNLTGGYSSVPVIKKETFNINDGELVSLIGLNGSGKSTTINHIIGLMKPFSGEIELNGTKLEDNMEKYKQQIAYIPELPVLYEELTLREHIELTKKVYQLNGKDVDEKVDSLLKLFRLDNKLDWFPSNFSKGMKQKVMIVCAFMTDASLFIIDEPFLGLDPLAVNDLLELIDEKKKEGKSILMSTHVLDTAEKHCDKFILLSKGEIQIQGTIDEIKDFYKDLGDDLNDIYLALARDEK